MKATRTDPPLFGEQPRYLALAESLSQEIKSRKYPVGTLLPTEAELCAQHAVSRHTIREAIRKLRDLGLVSRHHGIGTRVESTDVPSRYVLSLGSIPDMWQYVGRTRVTVLRQAMIPAHEASIPLPEIGGDNRWLALSILRSFETENHPVSETDVFINGAFSGIADHIQDTTVPFFGLIEKQYGHKVVSIQQDIGAVALSARQAKLMKIERGAPALRILRTYQSVDRTILEVSQSVTPTARFTYSMKIELEYAVSG